MASKKKGRLIALDGTSGPELAATGQKLVRGLCGESGEGGVSGWDASGIFWELRKGGRDGSNPSPRTLLLLYACDLAFRLRWEILPALDEGMVVVAAPYVESAIAFGRAAEVPRGWLVELFRFAAQPEAVYRLKEKPIPEWRGKRSEGYLEFCCKTLIKGSPAWDAAAIHNKALEYLEDLEERGGCRTVSEKMLARR